MLAVVLVLVLVNLNGKTEVLVPTNDFSPRIFQSQLLFQLELVQLVPQLAHLVQVLLGSPWRELYVQAVSAVKDHFTLLKQIR